MVFLVTAQSGGLSDILFQIPHSLASFGLKSTFYLSIAQPQRVIAKPHGELLALLVGP
jgi:hypothetical protein